MKAFTLACRLLRILVACTGFVAVRLDTFKEDEPVADMIETARVVPGLDPPTLADHRRIRRARRVARSRLLGSDPTNADLHLAAFREELGAVVRSASPLIVSMLASKGMTLDEAVEWMVRVGGWPIYPSLTGRFSHSLNSALPLRSCRT